MMRDSARTRDAPYCYQHWPLSGTGYGYRPAGTAEPGPHWSPLTIDHQMYATGDLLGVN